MSIILSIKWLKYSRPLKLAGLEEHSYDSRDADSPGKISIIGIAGNEGNGTGSALIFLGSGFSNSVSHLMCLASLMIPPPLLLSGTDGSPQAQPELQVISSDFSIVSLLQGCIMIV